MIYCTNDWSELWEVYIILLSRDFKKRIFLFRCHLLASIKNPILRPKSHTKKLNHVSFVKSMISD